MSEFSTTKTSKFSILEPNSHPHSCTHDSSSDSECSSEGDGVSECVSDEVDIQAIQSTLMEQIVSSSSYNIACNLSKIERRKQECIGDITLTYGEVLHESYRDVVSALVSEYGGLPMGGKFYDLGSGRGRASFCTTLLVDDYYHTTHYLSSCVGIEIISSLHELSLEALEQWCVLYPEYIESYGTQRGLTCPSECVSANASPYSSNITLLLGSITDLQCCDWTDGDLVFVNSTCFTGKHYTLHIYSTVLHNSSSILIKLTHVNSIVVLLKLN
jgi:hypothetical protein